MHLTLFFKTIHRSSESLDLWIKGSNPLFISSILLHLAIFHFQSQATCTIQDLTFHPEGLPPREGWREINWKSWTGCNRLNWEELPRHSWNWLGRGKVVERIDMPRPEVFRALATSSHSVSKWKRHHGPEQWHQIRTPARCLAGSLWGPLNLSRIKLQR